MWSWAPGCFNSDSSVPTTTLGRPGYNSKVPTTTLGRPGYNSKVPTTTFGQARLQQQGAHHHIQAGTGVSGVE
jgi:hypothetical protein